MTRLIDLDPIRIQADRDRFLLALDDILNDRGEPKEIAKAALAGKEWQRAEG